MAARLEGIPGIAALELNISCPNVTGGVDFGIDPKACEKVVAGVRAASSFPILAKLTPNVTNIVEIARAAEAGGADAISLINTCLAMAVNWRKRRPILGKVLGGLSGPAIKPIALRMVYQVAGAVQHSPDGHRRNSDHRRCNGISGNRRNGRSNRHGKFLQPNCFNANTRCTSRGFGRTWSKLHRRSGGNTE